MLTSGCRPWLKNLSPLIYRQVTSSEQLQVISSRKLEENGREMNQIKKKITRAKHAKLLVSSLNMQICESLVSLAVMFTSAP